MFYNDKLKKKKDVPFYFKERLKMRDKMEKPESKKIYQLRKTTTEPVIGNIKQNFGFREFLLKGLNKVIVRPDVFDNDLEENWAVAAEAIQTILRREAYPNPYEALKELTRTNEKITGKSIAAFIDGLNISEDVKKELRAITPQNYVGMEMF